MHIKESYSFPVRLLESSIMISKEVHLPIDYMIISQIVSTSVFNYSLFHTWNTLFLASVLGVLDLVKLLGTASPKKKNCWEQLEAIHRAKSRATQSLAGRLHQASMHGRAWPYTHVEEVPLDLLERGANMAQGDAPEAAGASEPRDFSPIFSLWCSYFARYLTVKMDHQQDLPHLVLCLSSKTNFWNLENNF